nr:hypothetical protein [uncultured Methanoregula sp.]
MPRRPTGTEADIPLYLLPHIVQKNIQQHGEEVEWLMAKRTSHHFYQVKIRTRPVSRELQVRKNFERMEMKAGGGA